MKVNAITVSNSKLKLKSMLWGFNELHGKLLPSLIFNSRLDTLLGDSHLGQYLIKHRCIIPVSGFYEWRNKQPYYICSTSDIMFLAGVFVHDDHEIRCSVATVDSTGFLKTIHRRMPIILDEIAASDWIAGKDLNGPSLTETEESIIDSLIHHRVSQAVNDTSFESNLCIEPVKDETLFT